MGEFTQDDAAMLEPGDLDKMDKAERESFHEMYERCVQYLIRSSNDFQRQYPHLCVKWRFQVEPYQTKQIKPARVSYSSQVY